MRLLCCLILFCLGYCAKNSVEALTESMGQEIIEIGAPVKEMPQVLDEEPSAEDDEAKETTTILVPATRKEIKKTTVSGDIRRKVKDIDKIDGIKDDEETRIEKELAEIYKDNVDYKADSAELNKEIVNNTLALGTKTIARSGTNFKFQPDKKEDIEKWRTSVDDIICEKRVTNKMALEEKHRTQSAHRSTIGVLRVLVISTIVGYTL